MFEPPVALASLSGRSDAEWARAGAEYAGGAFLGGIAVDEPTREAARSMVERDREEFLPEDPLAFLDDQLSALSDVPLRAGVNVRASGPEPVGEVAALCAEYGAILEVNAHCRQAEMCAAGAGQSLLRNPSRLEAQVRAASDAGATTSTKVRTEVDGVDLPEIARRAVEAGADLVHVDAMDSEPVVGDVVEAVPEPTFVVANNEVRGPVSVREYLDYGADAVSVGRPSTDPRSLERVHAAVREFRASPTR